MALLTLPVAARAAAAKPELPRIELDDQPAFPLARHLEQSDIAAGAIDAEALFQAGDLLFHTSYNGFDGVGMMRTVGGAPMNRFSIGPAGGGQAIAVGAQSCGGCHGHPFKAAAGPPPTSILFDADQDGVPPFNLRSTTSLYGNGLLQLVAQEMTEQLQAIREATAAQARAMPGKAMRGDLRAGGVEFGAIAATADAAGLVSFDLAAVRGVDPDLVVRPFGWKGNIATVRDFMILPAVFGLGMQAEEFVWRLPESAGPDPDGDGVVRELSVGDITALTVYSALQETPQPIAKLVELGMVAAPDAAALARVERGRALFARAGCESCHLPEIRLANTQFEEPTTRGNGNYLDHFLASKDANYDPARPVRADLLRQAQPPRVEAHPQGGAIVRLYGDLKRHQMGSHLAEPGALGPTFQATLAPLKQGEAIVILGADEFLTPELWGVGSTGPWLHDGRAGSLAEAILLHGVEAPAPPGDRARGEGQEARDAFVALSADDRAALVSFLKSLVTFSPEG